MHIRGWLGRDAPDPALETLEKARRMPVPVFGLVPQRHLEDWDAFSVSSGSHNGVFDSCEVSLSYTLWRNPEYIDDPVNLAEDAVSKAARRESDTNVDWPRDDPRQQLRRDAMRERPDWLLERLRRMLYPLLWECVATHWRAEPREHDRVEARLVSHLNHILTNRFRQTRVRGSGAEDGMGDLDSPVDERHVEHNVTVRVNGFERQGIRIDTDPDVFGVGVALDPATCVTAVVPRDELRFVDLAFATRPL